MPLTVAYPDRKRRQFTLPQTASLLDLIRLIHAEFPMDAHRLYFQGREVLEEMKTFADLGFPENALLRLDDLETPRTHPILLVQPDDQQKPPSAPATGSEGDDQTTATPEIMDLLGFAQFGSSKGRNHRASDLSGFRKTSRAQFRTFRVGQRGRGIRASVSNK